MGRQVGERGLDGWLEEEGGGEGVLKGKYMQLPSSFQQSGRVASRLLFPFFNTAAGPVTLR